MGVTARGLVQRSEDRGEPAPHGPADAPTWEGGTQVVGCHHLPVSCLLGLRPTSKSPWVTADSMSWLAPPGTVTLAGSSHLTDP